MHGRNHPRIFGRNYSQNNECRYTDIDYFIEFIPIAASAAGPGVPLQSLVVEMSVKTFSYFFSRFVIFLCQ
jgi:hypothetical protein